MCMFNTGCPGWEDYRSEDGFFPCDEETGCATAYHETIQKALTEDYPLETKGRYDRFATSKENSVWVCADCGGVCDPDTHDEECPEQGGYDDPDDSEFGFQP